MLRILVVCASAIFLFGCVSAPPSLQDFSKDKNEGLIGKGCLPPVDLIMTAIDEGYRVVESEEAPIATPADLTYIWFEKPAPDQNLNEEWIMVIQIGYLFVEGNDKICPTVFIQKSKQQTLEDY